MSETEPLPFEGLIEFAPDPSLPLPFVEPSLGEWLLRTWLIEWQPTGQPH